MINLPRIKHTTNQTTYIYEYSMQYLYITEKIY